MRYVSILGYILGIITLGAGISFAVTDLPMSDSIKIVKVTPYGSETRQAFEIKTDDFSYENLQRLILERIKKGYKSDCGCDFDNEYFLQLENRPVSESDWGAPIPVKFVPKTPSSYKLLFKPQCRILLSKNRKYAGLEFAYVNVGQFVGHHFILVNSRGEMQWESEYQTVKMPVIWDGSPINLPQDVDGCMGVQRVISNDGKLLVWKNFISMPEPWSLYNSKGKLLKTNTIGGKDAVFSDNGDYFLIQETRDPAAKLIEPDSGTACYNANGDIEWHREDILPFQNYGYCISPSGNNIIAYFKKTPLLFDNCID